MLLTAPDCFHLRSSFLPRSFCFTNSKVLTLNSQRTWASRTRASLITTPDSFQVGRLIGSYGFMNITSYSGFQPGSDAEYSLEDVGRLRVQDVGEGNVKIRLHEGIITQGPLRGTPVIFKVYPGQRAAGVDADMMAANELSAHAFLQLDIRNAFLHGDIQKEVYMEQHLGFVVQGEIEKRNEKDISQNIQILLGGFETKTGEQWLALRDDGKYSAADYAKVSSENLTKNRALGVQKSWNPFEEELTIKRKREFVIKLLRGAMSGLAYMHDQDRLHQSLGPSSVVLNTIMERDAAYLVSKLRDLAFSVDIRYSSMEKGPGILDDGLWRRASAAGAFTLMDKRAFGISDDIYEAGLLFAYLAFVPFCEAGIMDCLSLQRLLESTFQLDLKAMREYCLADDRLLEAVKFLDLGDGAGWELLQVMLNPDFRKRPIAEAVLNHRFMTGAVL